MSLRSVRERLSVPNSSAWTLKAHRVPPIKLGQGDRRGREQAADQHALRKNPTWRLGSTGPEAVEVGREAMARQGTLRGEPLLAGVRMPPVFGLMISGLSGMRAGENFTRTLLTLNRGLTRR